jgi:AraC-like DNA-binding protein
MPGTHLASSARFFWRILEQRGRDASAVFRAAGLDPARLTDPRARYPIERVARAWNAADRLLADPCFGLDAVHAWRASDYHALGYAMLASRSLRRALERMVRYFRIINDVAGFDLLETAERLTIAYVPPAEGFGLAPSQEQARWASILGICRALYDGPLDPVEVTMRQVPPPCPERVDACFRCPVRFGAPRGSIAFDRQSADRPLVAANREMATANDRIAVEYLARLQRDDLTSRVQQAILDHLPSGAPRDDQVAQALFLSTRTLQRRLRDEGTTFSDTLEAVRRELAEAYLRDQSLTLTEISYLLGFGNTSSFSRAYRRWTGVPPSTHRQQLA